MRHNGSSEAEWVQKLYMCQEDENYTHFKFYENSHNDADVVLICTDLTL